MESASPSESANAERTKRHYGKSCVHCKKRKRKCEISATGPCALCRKDGVECEIYTRRVRVAASATAASDGEEAVSSPGLYANSSSRKRQRRSLPSKSSNPAVHFSQQPDLPLDVSSQVLFDNATAASGSIEAFTSGMDFLPVVDIPPSSHPSPRSMATGHGSSFVSAMNNLVTKVCGDTAIFEVNEALLQTYFVWQAPQHLPVDEQLFRRDMASQPTGKYFSVALLHAIHAQASRHILSKDEGWRYADQAEALILASLSRPPDVTSIQALLILAGRDLALGQSSTSWTQSGMALRMMTDMGLERSLHQVTDQADEDVQLRRRLFWSCYCWDKFFALTMGRAPVISLPSGYQASPEINPPFRTMWTPYYPEDRALSYQPQPSFEAETFEACCLLYRDIDLIITSLYIGHHHIDPYHDVELVQSITQRLLAWRRQVSPNVLLDSAYLPEISPPPHILTLNILYRTAWIIFQKPFIGRAGVVDSGRAQRTCTERSAEIYSFFALHQQSFGLRNITYVNAYSAYVSATVDVADVLSGDPLRSDPAAKRLELTLRVLTQAAEHTPGIQRSIHYLRQKLSKRNDARSAQRSRAGSPTTAHPSGTAYDQDISTNILAVPAVADNLFADPQFGSSLDELFASLLPEFSSDLEWLQQDTQSASTAFLPIEGIDWLTGV